MNEDGWMKMIEEKEEKEDWSGMTAERGLKLLAPDKWRKIT